MKTSAVSEILSDSGLASVGMGTSGARRHVLHFWSHKHRLDLHSEGMWGFGGTGREIVIVCFFGVWNLRFHTC